jgi:hypothetical protein
LVSVVPFKKTYQDLFRQCGVTENVTIKKYRQILQRKRENGVLSYYFTHVPMYLSMYHVSQHVSHHVPTNASDR